MRFLSLHDLKIASPKDFWTGVMFLGFGFAAFAVGWEYRFGQVGRMGPGYFPRILAVALIVIGLLSLVRGLIVEGEKISRPAWKPTIYVLTAILLFGVLINRAGLIVSLFVLVLVSAAASKEFRLAWKPLLGLAALVFLCSLVFVKGLGVPMPLYGAWFEPYVQPLVDQIVQPLNDALVRNRPTWLPLWFPWPH